MRRNATIQKKIISTSLVLTVIPLVLLEIVFFFIMQRGTFQKYSELATTNGAQLAENIAAKMDELEQQADMLSDFSPLDIYLNSEFESNGAQFVYYVDNIHPMLYGFNSASSGVRVRVYHNRPNTHIYSFELSNTLDDLVNKSVLEGFQINSTGCWTNCDIRYNAYEPALSYFLAVPEKSWPYNISYVISVHINEDFFYSQISNEPQESALIYIINADGEIITSNHRDDIGQRADVLLGPALQMLDEDVVSINGNKYLPVKSETNGRQILYFLSYQTVHQELLYSTITLVMVGLALLFLSSLLLIRFSRQLTSRIQVLIAKMKNINIDTIRKLSEENTDQEGCDEIVQLDTVFTAMMSKIDVLIDEAKQNELRIKDERILRHQAELRALQHQINPHYLFNTLEAIRMNLILRDDRENAQIVKLFSDSFRRYVDLQDESPMLLEEIEFIKKYILIQNYRLSRKIKLNIHCDEHILYLRIAKLLLQPIIENAVYHGIEMKEDAERISLHITQEEKTLTICIEDDGVGMTEDELTKLLSAIRGDTPSRSVGLYNVYHRIKLIYGNDAQFAISSKVGHGTSVTLTIPIQV